MEAISESPPTLKIVKVIYILNFIAIVFPVCSIIGVVFAYIFAEDAQTYLKSHMQYLIRGFWMSILYFAISGILCLLFIGYVLLFISTVWWIIRNVKGFKNLLAGQEVRQPETWLF